MRTLDVARASIFFNGDLHKTPWKHIHASFVFSRKLSAYCAVFIAYLLSFE
jgi:hypothetical protein